MDRPVSHVAASISALELDLGNECLWWGEQQVALTPKAFLVLRYLVEQRDRLVTKQALLDAVWPDTYVEEGQVKQFIAELRRILHDDPDSPRFIETVRGRGYRLVGDIGLRTPALNLVPQTGPLVSHRGDRVHAPLAADALGADIRDRSDGTRHSRLDPDSNRPSIAVLPFRSLGGNPGDETLAEGITGDVIDGFTRSRSVLVVPRHSMLQFRGQPVDARRIGADLGVGYLLDGTVWRRAGTLKISANLVDAAQDRTLWAERYEGCTDDAVDFQERIASSIVASIEPRLFEAEIVRLGRKPPDRFDAYDCVLRASSLLYTFDEADLTRAGAFLDRAIELDPNSARAYAYKAWWYVLCIYEERSRNPLRDTALAEAAARRAMALDPMDAFVLAVAGHVKALLQGRPERAAELFDASLRLNENSAFAWGLSAVTHCYLGSPEEALGRLNNAWRLSPFDPLNFMSWSAAGLAEFLGGRYDRAIAWLERALQQNPGFVASHRTLTTCLWHVGRQQEARAAARGLLALDPRFRISTFASRYPLRRPGDLKRYIGGLRAAGVPE